MLRRTLVSVLLLGLSACAAPSQKPAAPPPADPAAKALADGYIAAYFDRFPEQATEFGVPGRHHDKLTDNSLDALKAWEAREDAWLADAKAIAPSAIASSPLRAAYAIAREALESNIGSRVCRDELWNVSQMTGWQVDDGYLVTIQPVGNEQARTEALARWALLPHYIDTEIVNLREGLKLGYTAPKESVRIVLDQINTLATASAADSPFMSPVQRDKDPAFGKAFTALVSEPARAGVQALPRFSPEGISRGRARSDRRVGQSAGQRVLRGVGSLSQLVAGHGDRCPRARPQGNGLDHR